MVVWEVLAHDLVVQQMWWERTLSKILHLWPLRKEG